jgi:60 kDa SS-A/Ro ribonucleoprotein
MANRTLFRSLVGRLIPAADARNRERAPAYRFPPRHALAQLAATGCLNTTFYADAEHQLRRVLDLAERVTPEFVAKTAVYCRERANMKDMPALLLAALSRREPALMDRVFDRVIDSPRMLRTFVQIVRSGRRTEITRVGTEAMRAPLARDAKRRGNLRRVGRQRTVARRRRSHGASEAGHAQP